MIVAKSRLNKWLRPINSTRDGPAFDPLRFFWQGVTAQNLKITSLPKSSFSTFGLSETLPNTP
jgi:hypothetical protein